MRLSFASILLAAIFAAAAPAQDAANTRLEFEVTGLKGRYDYKLEFTFQPAPGQGPVDARDFVDGAVEKLGLKLESKKGTTEVLLVDHAERPSAN